MDIDAEMMNRLPGVAVASSIQACAYMEKFESGIERYATLPSPTAQDDRWVGVCYFQTFQDDKAEHHLRVAVNRGVQAARINLAHLLRHSDRANEAHRELEQIDYAALSPYDRVLFLRIRSIHQEADGRLKESLRGAEEAWRCLQGISEFALLAPSVLTQLGILHCRIGRAKRALWFLDQAALLTTGLERSKVAIRRAYVLVTLGMHAQALLTIGEVVRDSAPDQMKAELEWLQGDAFLLSGDVNKARLHYKRAIANGKEHGNVFEQFLCFLSLSSVDASQHRFVQAQEHIRAAQDLITDDSDMLLHRFREIVVLFACGTYSAAHSLRAFRSVESAFSDMGLLHEQGQVKLHICRILKLTGDHAALEDELNGLFLLSRSLENSGLLDRELQMFPEMRADTSWT